MSFGTTSLKVVCEMCGATGTVENNSSSTLRYFIDVPCAKCGNKTLKERTTFNIISGMDSYGFGAAFEQPRMKLDRDVTPTSVTTYEYEYKQEKKERQKVERENDQLRRELNKHDPKTRRLTSKDYFFPYSVEGKAWVEDFKEE